MVVGRCLSFFAEKELILSLHIGHMPAGKVSFKKLSLRIFKGTFDINFMIP